MPSISIRSGERTWSADGPRVFTIGRDLGSDVVSADPTVSRRHAEVRPAGDGWEVVDLGSASGTYVGGRRVERHRLAGTTVLGFGQGGRALQLTVTVAAPAAAAPGGWGGPPSSSAPQPFQPPQAPQSPQPQRPQAPYGAPPARGAFPPPAAGYQGHAPGGPVVPGGPGGGQPGGPGQQPYRPAGPTGPLETPTMVTMAPVLPGLGPGLLVRRRTGGDLRFPPGRPVRIGRDPSLEVVADDTAVSRLHATLEPGPQGWTWTDRSTSGTYVDGERKTQFRIEEPTEISLGHPTAGYELEVVPVVAVQEAQKVAARRRTRRSLAVVAGVAGLLALLVGGGVLTWLVVRDDDQPPPVAQAGLTDAELDRAKAASVLLTAFDADGQPLYSGSGSIISDDGLVLTNAHVGDPDAPGQSGGDVDVDHITVSLTSGQDDAPAAAAYRATPVVSDGYLDIAVLQIDADADGDPVDTGSLDLPEPLPIGDSDALRTGDEIVALGFPAIGNVRATGDRPLTVTEGVVSTFQADPIVGTERGSIDSDVRLGSGNSGGASINEDGEIIGLNTRVVTAASTDAGSITQGSALIVPVNLAKPVLEIAEAGGDPDYVSPYLDQLEENSQVPPDATVQAAGWASDSSTLDCSQPSSPEDPPTLANVAVGDEIFAAFSVSGVPEGTPIAVELYSKDGTRIGSLSGQWDYGEAEECISVPYTLEEPQEGVNAIFFLGESSEPAAQNPVFLQ